MLNLSSIGFIPTKLRGAGYFFPFTDRMLAGNLYVYDYYPFSSF